MSLATLNDIGVQRGEVRIPLVGAWHADVLLDEAADLAGRVTLKLGDLELSGTAFRGGTFKGSGAYRVVAGADGWRKTLPPRAYRSDAGVRLSTILADVARESGESIALGVDRTVGTAFVRQSGPASRVFGLLGAVAPSWFVDAAGVTHAAARPVSTVRASFEVLGAEPDLGQAIVATEAPSEFLPGRRVEVGLPELLDVNHVVHVLESDSFTTVLCRVGPVALDRLAAGIREALPRIDYQAFYEFEVAGQSGDTLDVQPVDLRLGFPALAKVPMRPALAGSTPTLAARTRVLVGWVNGDPSRPYVSHYAQTSGDGGIPDELTLRAGATGAYPNEHATSAEAMVNMHANVLNAFALTLQGLPPLPLLPATLAAILLSPANASIVNAALAAAGVGPTATIVPYKAALDAALATKLPNTTGLLPSVGWPSVKGG